MYYKTKIPNGPLLITAPRERTSALNNMHNQESSTIGKRIILGVGFSSLVIAITIIFVFWWNVRGHINWLRFMMLSFGLLLLPVVALLVPAYEHHAIGKIFQPGFWTVGKIALAWFVAFAVLLAIFSVGEVVRPGFMDDTIGQFGKFPLCGSGSCEGMIDIRR